MSPESYAPGGVLVAFRIFASGNEGRLPRQLLAFLTPRAEHAGSARSIALRLASAPSDGRTTLVAVNDRNFGDLALFVSALQWRLKNRRRVTLVVVSGLMIGSLRRFWPWQTEHGEVLDSEADFGIALLLINLVDVAVLVLVLVLVLGILAAEAALIKQRMLSSDVVADPEPRSKRCRRLDILRIARATAPSS
ncbi:undecaprenyl phosphate translocase family protein [Salinibacterium sp. PAMC 21357]|uniref:undecaprenyl phosphate translocase family protein n=1 Tax=Salinibacterium sp. PAMC 21357 TaxID=1112215 RepID=UPI000287BC6C|nr:DUF368 domain-containing protein [Salinibacterium sp. PAMC 21357]